MMGKTGDKRSKTRRDKHKAPSPAPVMPRTNVETAPADAPGRRPFVSFDRERAAYERLKPALLAKAEGKYVVIVGDEVIGPLESHEDAELVGYTRFGIGPLYVNQVLGEEPVVEITRFHAG